VNALRSVVLMSLEMYGYTAETPPPMRRDVARVIRPGEPGDPASGRSQDVIDADDLENQ
jgi:hypothetical protein